MMPHKVHGVYSDGRKLYTKSLIGKGYADEEITKEKNVVFRQFDPFHSKLAAFIVKGSQNTQLKEGNAVLYLGSSTGTTVSHVADILGEGSIIFAVDVAPVVMRTFVLLTKDYPTIAPILASASQPDQYTNRICQVDYLYQDVATRDQANIFRRNAALFLKPQGFGFLAVKARSIDVSRRPKAIFNEIKQLLSKEFVIIEERVLEPFSKDHIAFLVKKL